MSASPDFCFLTSSAYPRLQSDYHPILRELQARGYSTEVEIWNDQKVDWSAMGNLVIGSIWDYHQQYDQFKKWLFEAKKTCNIINSPELIDWNLKKTYLKALENEGVPVIPTLWLGPQSLSDCPWSSVVIKPSLGAGSYGMKKFDLDLQKAEALTHIESLKERAPIMVQPKLESVSSEGEFVMVYFDGVFSHAASRPLGGHEASVDHEIECSTHRKPSKTQLNIGEKVIANLPSKPCYA
ncbi:MAG: hypothetical protein K8F91_15565, partial [Candidatus Obscuribacterales bacterium]|nr:hypothetical protein [Candidatus Obscuribacterales bacterium]